MGWSKGVKSTSGLTEGSVFVSQLGDSSAVHQWANAPQTNLGPGTGYIQFAEWGMGSSPYNTWIPLGAVVSMITLGSMTKNVWYDAFELLCQKKPIPVYLVLKICRIGEASDTTVNYELVLVKRTKDSVTTDEEVSGHRVFGVYNGAGHVTSLGEAHFYSGQFDYGSSKFYGAGICVDNEYDYGGDQFIFTNSTMFAADKDIFWGKVGTPEPEGEVTSPEFGPGSEPGGGYIPGGGTKPGGPDPLVPKIPSFDNTSDLIEIDPPPTLTALTSDLVHAYKVTDSELDLVAEAMYPDYVISATDVKDALIGIWNSIFFSKYVDYLLDLLILPIDVPAPNAVYMKAGGRFLIAANSTEPGSKISSHLVTQQYVDFSCGSISVDEYWVNFLDFTGTKVKLFLPYVGYVDIQPEYVIGGTLYVDYRFNICDGSFICYVRSDSGYSELEESMIGQYAGVAAMHIPLQSSDYSNKVAGLISAIGTVAAGTASGGVAAAGAGAAASAVNTLIQKPGSTHANGYNASSSFLSNRTPYLIIERQWGQFSEKYPDEVGLPSNVMCRIGDLTGLVKSQNAHLDTIPCTSEMKERISSLLADGIIVG